MTDITGWGRYPVVQGYDLRSENLERITADAVLSRGLGRSYGDSSLPPEGGHITATTVLADRLISFDPLSGVLRAEAGLSLWEMNRLFLRRGWFTPVTPGTQFVTLGGMVAADVHGKNHHLAGCFGEHVRCLKLRTADGRIIECSEAEHPGLFRATIGGMGLTGHILEVEVRLESVPSPWIWSESRRMPDLDAMLGGLAEAAKTWPFTVGWIDCLARGKQMGKGILMCGRWADREEAPPYLPPAKRQLRIPFDFPGWVLGPWTVKAFNRLYYWKHGAAVKSGIHHPESFFYPLDAIRDWNRMYGRRGFTQYQCVLPKSGGAEAVRKFLELLTRLGGASFLSVIKDCGAEGKGMLSFPKPGVSIALDIAIRDVATKRLVDTLNDLVIAEGGRVYLAKDAFTSVEDYRAMETRLEEWNRVRRQWDPQGRLRSAQSVRLMGDTA